MKKDKKKKCGFCEMRKKLKENVRDSYARQGTIEDYLKEMAFANSKPFKLNFKEGFNVSFKNFVLTEAKNSKTMTTGQKEKTKIKLAKKLKPKKK